MEIGAQKLHPQFLTAILILFLCVCVEFPFTLLKHIANLYNLIGKGRTMHKLVLLASKSSL